MSEKVELEFLVDDEVSFLEVDTRVELEFFGPFVPLSGGSGGTASYTHTQSSPAATWTINHNLGIPREPVVLLDSDPTQQVWTDVEHGSINQTTLTFPTPVTGKAYF